MLVRDLISAVETFAPRALAESWDNTGLLIGSAGARVAGPVLLTIDLTDEVLEEARGLGASAVIAYHPPIFEGQKRITDGSRTGRTILRAIELGLAVYSPHTALDAAPGGMTDWLADGLAKGSTEGARRAITPAQVGPSSGEQVKIVTFIPAEREGAIREALGAAGAGVIGRYVQCSFSAPGTGTFLGGEGTSPAVGQRGRLESAPELRFEMVCPRALLDAAVGALRRAHPYEEPAIDVIPLVPLPVSASGDAPAVGSGRMVTLDAPVPLSTLAARLRSHLGVAVQASRDCDRPVGRVALVPGAGGSLIGAAKDAGCEAFVTGELKHHETLAAIDAGLSLLLAGHTETERGYLPVFAQRLAGLLPAMKFVVSVKDVPPMMAVPAGR